MKLVSTLLATSIAVLGSSQVMAYETGDIMIKAGVINVTPKDDNLKGRSSALNADVTVQVKGDTQIGLTATYMVSPQVGVELLAATPFKHKIEVNGDTAGTTKHLPPTISALYYPMDSSSALQPYVGAGVNMTFFFDEAGIVKGDSLGSLSDSLGWSLSAGINYDIDDKFMANFAVWYMDINTTLDGTDKIGLDEDEVEIDPIVVMAGVGYKF
jgi:outer membrane protein